MIWQKRRKYGNKPVISDGSRFDSTAEFKRYCQLQLLERAGQISHCELHPRFKLNVNGQHICDYVADFTYFEDGKRIIEDVKGGTATQTDVFRLKAKLMRAIYGVEIRLTGKGV